METKADIRQRILGRRNALSPVEKKQAEEKITETLLNLEVYRQTAVVLGFVGYGSEPDTFPFLECAVRDGKKVYCPVSKQDGTMEFYRYTKKNDLSEGYKNIPEPSEKSEKFEKKILGNEKSFHTFMLMPGVAFDMSRHRIGYGKGFYDRYLADYRPDYIAAVCFECQIVEAIPAETFDVMPDLVVTEKGIIGRGKG